MKTKLAKFSRHGETKTNISQQLYKSNKSNRLNSRTSLYIKRLLGHDNIRIGAKMDHNVRNDRIGENTNHSYNISKSYVDYSSDDSTRDQISSPSSELFEESDSKLTKGHLIEMLHITILLPFLLIAGVIGMMISIISIIPYFTLHLLAFVDNIVNSMKFRTTRRCTLMILVIVAIFVKSLHNILI